MKEYIRHQKARMFESDFFEFFSKVRPSSPFIFWIPIGVGTLGYALYRGVTTPGKAAVTLPLGFVGWQAMEYFIHRDIFHWIGEGAFAKRFHELVHGYHHKYPDDDDRLVMPIAISLGVAGSVAAVLSVFRKPAWTVPLWTGLLGGYLFYDFTHWSTHFRKPLTEWGKRLRAHHMAHHFADHEANFGISNFWMDTVMGTLKKRGRDEARNQDETSGETESVPASSAAPVAESL